ncbi:MAG: DUF924 family protein [Pseudomonadota bacterium]|nr:hypothetical protein [Pseudomonadales bacterium]MDY6921177.1 DUF924 family protein [Pseudomonadota bacterium]
MDPEAILDFWFHETNPRYWFRKDQKFDQLISSRFGALLKQGCRGELFQWRDTARGRLAEILVLDQFSRNIHRGSALAFAADGMALVLAQEAVAAGLDRQLEARERSFLYMPYMHSESLAIHRQAVQLFQQPGLEDNLKFELKHREILERFGRYPHRNALLGRVSTPEELAFLQQPGSGF